MQNLFDTMIGGSNTAVGDLVSCLEQSTLFCNNAFLLQHHAKR